MFGVFLEQQACSRKISSRILGPRLQAISTEWFVMGPDFQSLTV